MSNENEAGVLDQGETGQEEPEERRSYTGYCLLAVTLLILAIGTGQVLSANADREAQARKVKDAQARMEILN